jgi:hypothetical protein
MAGLCRSWEEGTMPSPLDRLSRTLSLGRCCPPPPAVSGLSAAGGGGSGEVVVTWDPLPAGARVRFYRVYERKGKGRWWQLAVVTDEVLGDLAPGKIGVVDAPDYWPWPSGMDSTANRCYAVSAVSTRGLEGPLSRMVCAVPT